METKYDTHINNNEVSLYSIKISNNEMWIKNEIDELNTSFINIKKINLKDMLATNVKILIINEDSNKYIIAEKGKFEKMNLF